MQGGKLRYIISIQKPDSAPNDTGQSKPTWTDVIEEIRADVRDATGREFNAHDKVNSEITHNVFTRWAASIKPEYRVKWNDGRTDRYLNIIQVVEDRTRNHMLIIKCKEDLD